MQKVIIKVVLNFSLGFYWSICVSNSRDAFWRGKVSPHPPIFFYFCEGNISFIDIT